MAGPGGGQRAGVSGDPPHVIRWSQASLGVTSPWTKLPGDVPGAGLVGRISVQRTVWCEPLSVRGAGFGRSLPSKSVTSQPDQ